MIDESFPLRCISWKHFRLELYRFKVISCSLFGIKGYHTSLLPSQLPRLPPIMTVAKRGPFASPELDGLRLIGLHCVVFHPF